MVATDLDRDGRIDVLSASRADDKIAWYRNGGGGNTWTEQAITTTADSARGVAVADIDGDGDPDVLSASNYDDRVAWYANDGNGGGWAPTTISTADDETRSVWT